MQVASSTGRFDGANFNMISSLQRGLARVTACLTVLSVLGCDRAAQATPPKSQPSTAIAGVPASPPSLNGRVLYTGPYRTPKGLRGLTIFGYNYTDSYIDSFAVNGAGGGNIEVSDEGSVGGGTCCAPILDDAMLPLPVEISWRRDGESAPWCKQIVLLDGPVPKDPRGLAVHFYPDGSIQVELVEAEEYPRMKLPRYSPAFRKKEGNVNNDSKFSECRGERR